MGQLCTAWLPQEALRAGHVDRLIAEVTEQWSYKWFADRTVTRRGALAKVRPGTAVRENLEFYILEDGLAVASQDTARMAIAAAMLDAVVDLAKARPADRQLLDRLSASCIADLRSRLSQAFKLGQNARWQPAERLGVLPFDDVRSCALGFDGEDGEPLLYLYFCGDIEIALIKSIVSCLPAVRGTLQPLSVGLASQPIALSALLGRCDLTVAELKGLSEGDVIVLDRELDAPLEIVVDGQVKHGQCTVEQEGDQLRLKITKPLNE